jgi:hypothetical protein
MKAIRVTAKPDGTFTIAPLLLPVKRRAGKADPSKYEKLAKGEDTQGHFDLQPADNIRGIALSDGHFTGLATQAGGLLTIPLAGEITLTAGSQTARLEPGDILLTDVESAAVTLDVRNHAHLVQISVPSDWPGQAGDTQPPATIKPRKERLPKFKRIYTGDDKKAYFAPFNELLADPPNKWSAPTPVEGFRIVYWESGEMDWHPTVINQLGIICAGEEEFEVGGGGGAKEIFQAGDVCFAEDRTGQGHIGRALGTILVMVVVIETKYIWPWSI